MLNVPHRTYEREQQKIAAENSENSVKLSAADFEETTFLRSRSNARTHPRTRNSLCWKRGERGREREKKRKKVKKIQQTREKKLGTEWKEGKRQIQRDRKRQKMTRERVKLSSG